MKHECDEAGTSLNYVVLERAVGMARKLSADDFAAGCAFEGGSWKAEIEVDYEMRHGKEGGGR